MVERGEQTLPPKIGDFTKASRASALQILPCPERHFWAMPHAATAGAFGALGIHDDTT